MTEEKKVRAGTMNWVPIGSEGTPVTDNKEEATTSPNGATIDKTPMQFYARVTKRSDVRRILSRLAKD